VSSIQSIRPAFASKSSRVSASSATSPGVAADMGVVLGVDLSVLWVGDILAARLLDGHLNVARVGTKDSLPLIDGTLQVGHTGLPHSDGASCVYRHETLVAALGHFDWHLQSVQQPRSVWRYRARPKSLP
jgi:hypothetical protein